MVVTNPMMLTSEQCLLNAAQYARLLNYYDSFVELIRNVDRAYSLYKNIKYLSRFVWYREEDAVDMLVKDKELRDALDNLRSQMNEVVKLSIQRSLYEKESMTDVQVLRFYKMRKHTFEFIAIASICYNLNEFAKRRLSNLEAQ